MRDEENGKKQPQILSCSVAGLDLKFENLFDVEEIQAIQDAFAAATGVASIITDLQGRPITRPSNFCRLCTQIIRATPKGLKNCMKSDSCLGRPNLSGPIIQPCLSGGLMDGGVSICAGEHHIANWLVGQVLDRNPDNQKMMAYAREIGADEEEFRSALTEVTRMPREQFERICQTLFLMARQISKLALINLQQTWYIAERREIQEQLQKSYEELEVTNEELVATNEELSATEEELRNQFEEVQNSREALATANQKLMTIIDFLPDATFVIDRDKRVIAWNRALEKMTGVGKEEVIGKGDSAYSLSFYGTPAPMLVDFLIQDNQNMDQRYDFVKREGDTLYAEVFVSLLNQGTGAYVWGKASPLYDEHGKFNGAIETIRDITERKRAEENLRYLSMHDSITGLYNRTYFEERMRILEERQEVAVGLIMVDLDGLKLVNDTMGHEAGDGMLRSAAKVLLSAAREGDTVARIGGDEFAVLLPESTVEALAETCNRIRDAVDAYNRENLESPLSISIGFAIRSDASKTMGDLFKEADNLMYRVKLHRNQSIRSATVQTLLKALEARDFITEGHGERLETLMAAVGEDLGLPASSIYDLRLVAQFHDIGKVGIPDSILFKPGPLNPDEHAEMQRHSEIGYRIAQSTPDMMPIAKWILTHHEWWNGQGYPLGLKGEDIPRECRLLAIVDAYDAMTNDRPYRKALPHREAIGNLTLFSGIQFDPNLLPLVIQVIEKYYHTVKK